MMRLLLWATPILPMRTGSFRRVGGISGEVCSPQMGAELLAGAVERIAIGENGRSGSHLEKVRLSDGTKLVVKRTSRTYDRAAQVTDDDGREPRLFLSGLFDRFPPGVGHAILDVWSEGDEFVIVMRDVSAGLIPNEHLATYAEVDRVLGALSSLHGVFASGPPPEGLCPLASMLSNLFPASIAAASVEDEFPDLVLRGWERFHEIVPPDVSAGVQAMHEDPSGLAVRLNRFPSTFLHGDFWLVNCSLMPDEVVLFDWGLATWGPPSVEIAVFLSGHGSRMEPSREEVLARFAKMSRELHETEATRLALAHGLALMGWNKALDITEHTDPAMRARERTDLDWWVAHFDPS